MKTVCILMRSRVLVPAFTLALAGCAAGSHGVRHAGGEHACACAGAPLAQADQHRAGMQQHMQHMKELHAGMMHARSADERQALMAQHMAAMESGMAKMHAMMEHCPAGQGAEQSSGHPPRP